MPDDEAKAGADAQQPIDVPAGGGDKTKSVVMILIALSVIVMIFTPVVTIFAMRAMIGSQTPAAKEAPSADSYGETSIKGQQCIIGNSKGTRYVKVDVVIQYSSPSELKPYFEEKSADNPKGLQSRMKAEITRIIMGKQLEELDSPGGLKNLAEEIKEAIKGLLPAGTKGTIVDVFFPNFLIS